MPSLMKGAGMKVENVVTLEDGTKSVSSESLTTAVGDPDIRVRGFCANTKASELFAIVSYADGDIAPLWYIPYQYRRTDVFVDSLEEMVSLLKSAKKRLNRKYIVAYSDRIGKTIYEYFGKGASVTVPIFKKLLDNCGSWVWNKDFDNENPQRRIQDIKESGFTVATRFYERRTYHMLLPFDPVRAATYETIPLAVRRRIFRVHNGINSYTGEPASISCLPDHKFPELRWDRNTPESNADLSEQEMVEKFQIVPENINQMKREVCRKCFKSGVRGRLNGINFFYAGGPAWDKSIPKVGKLAERGCIGCFWYDMLAWRNALNRLIEKLS